MTNYNERLDEVLGRLIVGTQDLDFNKAHPNTYRHHANRAEAKQAITSLTKELVAEAKPEMKPYENSHEWYNASRKLDQFEQNLLKALEEV